jgi:hypothetical protein
MKLTKCKRFLSTEIYELNDYLRGMMFDGYEFIHSTSYTINDVAYVIVFVKEI